MIVRRVAGADYRAVWQAMRDFTDARDQHSIDQLWWVEHAPVFTQGQAGRPEHVLDAGDIPVVQIDRGGQVTYHGPGQVVLYPLLDLRRHDLGVRALVQILEQCVVAVLAEQGITAYARRDAPGVYVGDKKIAALGLRIRRGCSYHGLALNVNMDLAPFARINPCGYAGMAVTQCHELGLNWSWNAAARALSVALGAALDETLHWQVDSLLPPDEVPHDRDL